MSEYFSDARSTFRTRYKDRPVYLTSLFGAKKSSKISVDLK